MSFIFDSSAHSLYQESLSGWALNEELDVVREQPENVPLDISGHQHFNQSYNQQQQSLPNMHLINNASVLNQVPQPDFEVDIVSEQTENVPSDIYGQQQFNESYQKQQSLPNVLPVNSGVLNQVPQLEFFGHNIGCAPYPCYGGLIAACDPPMPYLHESRHLHAMNRARGSRGRFTKREEVDSSNKTASGSSKHVLPKLESSQTPRGESTNWQSYHALPSNHFMSSNIGEDWLNISSPNQG